MLASFPIAFWTGAFCTDVAGLVSHDGFWFRVSLYQIAAGTALGLVSAIAGTIDYLTVKMGNKAKEAADKHWIWSAVTLAFFVAGLAVRSRDAASVAGIIITSFGAIGLLAGAFYGSELVGKYHIGILERRRPVRGPGSNETNG
jgi:uncharacterized membrane protein